jgi:hydroxymethylpyrimidine pyrophosphatase-like HAD family hydrolase
MADIGYATENAIREVKAVADKIAPSNTENAIACIINSLNTKADTSGQ